MTQQMKDQPHWNDGDLEIKLDPLRPFPDPEMEAECLAAFDRGDRTTLQDEIDRLQESLRKTDVMLAFERRWLAKNPECPSFLRSIASLEKIKAQLQREEALAAVRQAKQRLRRYWPGVLVAVLVGLLLGAVLGAVLVGQYWGAG